MSSPTGQRELVEVVTPPRAIGARPVEGSPFSGARSVGVGSLPHRDAAAAAAFAMGEFDIATIPSLPKRSPAESMIARAIVGLPGVSLGQYGSFAVDPTHLADDVPIDTDLGGDAFVGLRAFLDLAEVIRKDGEPLKWQFVGPVTLGVALHRAGLHDETAFTIAARAVRAHVSHIADEIAARLPNSPQLVLLDEPWLIDLMTSDFPIAPDRAVDLISTGMASVADRATVGVHCCGECDIATLVSTGPQVISVPARPELVEYAGYLGKFLDQGGVIAWGVVPTEGPVFTNGRRRRLALDDVWSGLIDRGVDARRLADQSLVSPDCGLSGHQVSVARQISRVAADVGRSLRG